MASIFKPIFTTTDSKTGKKVRKKTSKWYVKYRDSTGVVRRVPGYTDKEATRQLAAKLEKQAALEAVGVVDPFAEPRKRPLAEHLGDYERYLTAKGNTTKWVGKVVSRVRAVFDGCRFRRISDLNPSRVVQWLAEARRKGRSVQTSNHYLRAIKSFTRWLVRDRRMADDPLAHLSVLNAAADRRHERRILSPSELGRLVRAARDGGQVRGLPGPDRAMLYTVAAYSGLRASELASLTSASFHLDGNPPTVTLEAAHSKHRRKDVLPLLPALAERIRAWLGEIAAEAAGSTPETIRMSEAVDGQQSASTHRLWPGAWTKHAAEMVRRDLKAAGIPYRDESGSVFDFHALRHQFITNLAKSGAHPKIAQELARHGDIELTMQHYTHLGLRDTAGALDGLPALPSHGPGEAQATGTDGALVPPLVPKKDKRGHRSATDGNAASSQAVELASIDSDMSQSAEGPEGCGKPLPAPVWQAGALIRGMIQWCVGSQLSWELS